VKEYRRKKYYHIGFMDPDVINENSVFLSCRMKVKEYRRKEYYHIGFMDPDVINENSVNRWPNRTENNVFTDLDRQHTCTIILLPYNFK
jgi:hypothetical protein